MPKTSQTNPFCKTWALSTKNRIKMQACSSASRTSTNDSDKTNRTTRNSISRCSLKIKTTRAIIRYKTHYCRRSTYQQGILTKDLLCTMTSTTQGTISSGKEHRNSRRKLQSRLETLALKIRRSDRPSGLEVLLNTGRKIKTITIARSSRASGYRLNLTTEVIRWTSRLGRLRRRIKRKTKVKTFYLIS